MTGIRIDGIAKLRGDLKALEVGLEKRLNVVAKQAAEIVADEGRATAPRLTGRLAGSIKAGARVKGAFVKASTPYARKVHSRNPFLYDALDAKAEQVVRTVRDGVDDLIDDAFKGG